MYEMVNLIWPDLFPPRRDSLEEGYPYYQGHNPKRPLQKTELPDCNFADFLNTKLPGFLQDLFQ